MSIIWLNDVGFARDYSLHYSFKIIFVELHSDHYTVDLDISDVTGVEVDGLFKRSLFLEEVIVNVLSNSIDQLGQEERLELLSLVNSN